MQITTEAEKDTLQLGQDYVERYLSINPRATIFTCQIDGAPSQDAETLGYYQFNYTGGVGDIADIIVGMSVDIGTTAGAKNIGTTRIRKAPTGTIIYIAETAPGDLQLASGQYVTVVEELLPRVRTPRLVKAKTGGSAFFNDFTEYHDYDEVYTDQNYYMPPKANIVGEVIDGVEDGTYKIIPAKASGWASDDGWRYVKLSAKASFRTSNDGGGGIDIDVVEWGLIDGELFSGGPTDQEIVARFPDNRVFRYIYLIVKDFLETEGIVYFPIWVHTPENPPISINRVTSDNRQEGREMSFELMGETDEFTELDIPKGSLMCYWEVASFGPEGTAPPPLYIDQFLGWSVRDSILLKSTKDVLSLDMAGAQRWLNETDGFHLLLNQAEPPTTWYEMNVMTLERCVYYLLLNYTTLIPITNFFTHDRLSQQRGLLYPPFTRGEEIGKANMWTQIAELMKAQTIEPRYDSMNALWLIRNMNYAAAIERTLYYPVILALNPEDWTLEQGITFDQVYSEDVGRVTGGGSGYDGENTGDSYPYFSEAPGPYSSTGLPTQEMPFQRLHFDTAQDELNQAIGHHYARVRLKRQWGQPQLIGNYDVIEPAWGEPITITYQEENIRGLEIVSKKFLVRSVSVSHSADKGQKPKTISLTIEQETFGVPGRTRIVENTVLPINDNPVKDYYGGDPITDDDMTVGDCVPTMEYGTMVQIGPNQYEMTSAFGGGEQMRITFNVSGCCVITAVEEIVPAGVHSSWYTDCDGNESSIVPGGAGAPIGTPFERSTMSNNFDDLTAFVYRFTLGEAP